MASKLVFSLEGMKMGGTFFCSRSTKSMSRKNSWFVKVSNSRAPILLVMSFSSRARMACRHGIETGGFVTG